MIQSRTLKPMFPVRDNFNTRYRWEAWMNKYRAITIPSETVGKLLDAIYEQYPEGASSMPNKLEEAVINTLYELDELKD